MKRVIIIALLLLGSITASAQIKVVKKIEAVQHLASARMNAVQFNKFEGVYYLSVASSSDVDDALILYLGMSMESAKQSIFDIIDLFNELKKGESAVFTTMEDKREYKIRKPELGVSAYLYDGKARVGNTYVATGELQSLTEKVY